MSCPIIHLHWLSQNLKETQLSQQDTKITLKKSVFKFHDGPSCCCPRNSNRDFHYLVVLISFCFTTFLLPSLNSNQLEYKYKILITPLAICNMPLQSCCIDRIAIKHFLNPEVILSVVVKVVVWDSFVGTFVLIYFIMIDSGKYGINFFFCQIIWRLKKCQIFARDFYWLINQLRW